MQDSINKTKYLTKYLVRFSNCRMHFNFSDVQIYEYLKLLIFIMFYVIKSYMHLKKRL